jgi:hypothetical protein
VVGNPNVVQGDTSYKLAAAGHTVGTMTSDTPRGVIVGQGPATIPINVTARDLDSGHTITEDTQVADETGIGLPLGSSVVDLTGPLAVAQAATDVFDGTPVPHHPVWLGAAQRLYRDQDLVIAGRAGVEFRLVR